MSNLDPDTFLAATIDGANDTVVLPVPPGEYNARLEKFTPPREVNVKDGVRHVMDLSWAILDDQVRELLGRDAVVRQALWLDITDAGSLDMGKGKNIDLGRLREALSMNTSGFSFSNMLGSVAVVSIVNEADKNDSSKTYARVKSVGRAA